MVILVDMIPIILGPLKGSYSVNTCEIRVVCTKSHTSHSSQCLTLSRMPLVPVDLLLQLSSTQSLRIQAVSILRLHNQLHLQGKRMLLLGFCHGGDLHQTWSQSSHRPHPAARALKVTRNDWRTCYGWTLVRSTKITIPYVVLIHWETEYKWSEFEHWTQTARISAFTGNDLCHLGHNSLNLTCLIEHWE